MDPDDDLRDLRAATIRLYEFIDVLGSYGDIGPDSEEAARLIVDQQAAADTCVAVFQASVRRYMKNIRPHENT